VVVLGLLRLLAPGELDGFVVLDVGELIPSSIATRVCRGWQFEAVVPEFITWSMYGLSSDILLLWPLRMPILAFLFILYVSVLGSGTV